GDVDDLAGIPPDLLRRPRVILAPRPAFFDAYVAAVAGPRHVTRSDTIRLRVSYGTAGTRDGGRGTGKATLTVSVEGHRLASVPVILPDSGVLNTEVTLPASHVPRPGWIALDVHLDGVNDTESRDDTRAFVIDVSLEPAAVLFASPPDWDARFLARIMADVARVPVKVFVETEAGRWRDGATRAPVATADLTRGAANARLALATGEAARGDWLLGERGAGGRARAVAEALGQPNGLPIVWRWTSPDSAHALAVTLRSKATTRTDTLRFDPSGRAELLLPPGVYRYALSG